MTVVLTNCTSRKRAGNGSLQLSAEIMGRSVRDTVNAWRRVVGACVSKTRAVDVYVGRSVVDARAAADLANASLYFVSAGLGVVFAEEKIPAYDLTPSDPNGSLVAALSCAGANVTDWWSCLSENGVSRLVRQQEKHLILIALPATYLAMVHDDLHTLDEESVDRLRIFTSEAGAIAVPSKVRRAVLPYDERLESVDGFGGTRADFPQRALLHFVKEQKDLSAPIAQSAAWVTQSLSGVARRVNPKRKRLDDEDIKRLIWKRWRECKGQSSLLLRTLRDGESIACEQGRFVRLWREVRQEKMETST